MNIFSWKKLTPAQSGASKSAELSKLVHRVGYHFSKSVVQRACKSLHVVLNSHGRVINSNWTFLQEDPSDQSLHLSKTKPRLRADERHTGPNAQALLDRLAEHAILDLFPNIPRKDMEKVVARAFDQVSIYRSSALSSL